MDREARQTRTGAEVANCLHIISVMDYLCEAMSFDEMSVADICSASGLSRSTFYRLFDDKFDAVNWIMHELSCLGHNRTGRTLSWHDASLITLSGFELIRHLLDKASETCGYMSLRETSIRLRITNLTEALTMRGIEPDDELLWEISFFAHSEIPAVHRWYKQTASISAEVMAAYIDHAVPRRLHDALALPDNPSKGQKLTMGRIASLLLQQESRT